LTELLEDKSDEARKCELCKAETFTKLSDYFLGLEQEFYKLGGTAKTFYYLFLHVCINYDNAQTPFTSAAERNLMRSLKRSGASFPELSVIFDRSTQTCFEACKTLEPEPITDDEPNNTANKQKRDT